MDAPDKAIEIKGAVTAFLAFGTALFGWVGWLAILWLVSMVLDYITGSLAAISLGEWSSALARRGLWHKLGSIASVLVSALCDIALGVIAANLGDGVLPFDYDCFVTPVVLLWYVFTELGSIIENAIELGAPVPEFLVKIIKKAKDSSEDSDK